MLSMMILFTTDKLAIMRSIFGFIFLCCGLMFTSVVAASTWISDWAETDGGRMRLLVSQNLDDQAPSHSNVKAALEIELDQGWKTYWREPGDSGIPPIIDFSTNAMIDETQVYFPAPKRVDDGYSIWSGYSSSVIFPIDLTLSSDTLETVIISDIFIGICSDICVPFQARLEAARVVESSATKDIQNDILDAYTKLPADPASDFYVKMQPYQTAASLMKFEVQLPKFRIGNVEPEMFIDLPDGFTNNMPKLVSIDGDIAYFEVDIFDIPENSENDYEAHIVLSLGQRSIQDDIKF